METTLRAHGLNGAQYGVLSVLARDPSLSGADLARACNTTAQAMNGVLATLEREGLSSGTRTRRTVGSSKPRSRRKGNGD